MNATSPEHIVAPLPPSVGFCRLVHDFLSASECRALIAAAEHRGFASAATDYPPSYRNNARQVHDDPSLAGELLARMKARLPEVLTRTLAGDAWRLTGLNERLRACRYSAGERFSIHQDGVHHRGPDARSLLTFMIYLDDGDSFEGGDTEFFADLVPARACDGPTPIARVRPRAGSLIVFDHSIWHAGAVVTRGVKHILRSDLVYARVEASAIAADSMPPARAVQPAHDGYIWTLARCGEDRIASAGRDRTIRVWDRSMNLKRTLLGHTQSVLGLALLDNGRLASVSRDRSLRFWDLETGASHEVADAHAGAVLCVVALPDGRVATGGADGDIALWRHDGTCETRIRAHQDWVWALDVLVARDGTVRIASASEDGTLKLCDLARSEVVTIDRGRVALRTVGVNPCAAGDAWRVATGDLQGRVALWRCNMNRGERVRDWVAHAAAVRRVRWLRDDLLATCSEDRRLRLSRTEAATLHSEFEAANFVTDVAQWADGELAYCGYDGVIRRATC